MPMPNILSHFPDYYKQDIDGLKGDVSINQFIVNAIAQKIATLKTINHLEERATKGSKAHALGILNNAPDSQPQKRDRE